VSGDRASSDARLGRSVATLEKDRPLVKAFRVTYDAKAA
jgi:hypothetical protein